MLPLVQFCAGLMFITTSPFDPTGLAAVQPARNAVAAVSIDNQLTIASVGVRATPAPMRAFQPLTSALKVVRASESVVDIHADGMPIVPIESAYAAARVSRAMA